MQCCEFSLNLTPPKLFSDGDLWFMVALTHLIIYLTAATNNRTATVLQSFLEAVNEMGFLHADGRGKCRGFHALKSKT